MAEFFIIGLACFQEILVCLHSLLLLSHLFSIALLQFFFRPEVLVGKGISNSFFKSLWDKRAEEGILVAAVAAIVFR